MSQQTIQPPPEAPTSSAIQEEQQAFPKMAPLLPGCSDGITASKKTITASIDRVVAFWRALPVQRKRFIALLGLSIYLSVAMSVIVTLLARLTGKQPEREK
jgi:hypothetical protein